MAKPFSVAKQVSYNPFKDEFSTPRQKIDKVFTESQMRLVERPDVTKSLIKACLKVVIFKQDFDTVVAKWVGQPTSKFLRTLPLLCE